MKRFLSLILAVVMVLSMAALTGCKKDDEGTAELGSDPITVIMEVKGHGSMTIELYPDVAPVTVENFLKYVKDGFYDGLTFHRIIEDFMIQGGDNGSDDLTPIKGEFSANGFENDLKHTKGVISMARTNDMNSATSQFFICHSTASHLDGQYAAFGKVIEGLETLDSIANVEVKTSLYGEASDPVDPVIIEKVYISDSANQTSDVSKTETNESDTSDSTESNETTESVADETQKITEYNSDYTWVNANNGTSFYEFVFEKGVLINVYVEDDNGKDAFGRDCYQSLNRSEFYGMIVEEIVEKFESQNFEVTITEE